MKKERTTSEDWGTKWNEPQTRPKRIILRAYATRSW
jgi:hypothetical protein